MQGTCRVVHSVIDCPYCMRPWFLDLDDRLSNGLNNTSRSPFQLSSRALLLRFSPVRERIFPSPAVSSMYATIYPSLLRSTPRHALAFHPHLRLRRNSPRTPHPNHLTLIPPHPLTSQTTQYIQSGHFPRARVMLL